MIIIVSILGIVIVLALVVLFTLFTSSDRAVFLQRAKAYDYNGVSRSYLIREPSTVSQKTAIVVGLHGFSGDAKMFAYYTGIQNALPTSDILIYPQTVAPNPGEKTGWNAGFCCGSGWVQKAPDAEFILSLIESTKQKYNIPSAKVFIIGFSNGAFMAQRLAAEFPDSIDAVVSGSGTIGTEALTLQPQAPKPILLMHGEKDKRVNYTGGMGLNDPEFIWKSHAQTVNAWEQINKPTSTQTQAITYSDDAHQWHDWRLFNIWHKTPAASLEAATFLDKYR